MPSLTMLDPVELCAADLLELVPHLMNEIRWQVRTHSAQELSVPQFRALAFIGRNADCTLSDVAAFLGLSMPSASKLVEGLVSQQLAQRKEDAQDRRRTLLQLTASGEVKHTAARQVAHDFLSTRLSDLDRTHIATISEAVRLLRTTFREGGSDLGPVSDKGRTINPK